MSGSSLESQLIVPVDVNSFVWLGGQLSNIVSDGSGSLIFNTINQLTAALTPHTLQTGDLVYAMLKNGGVDPSVYSKRYAIRISATSLKIANTRQNALDGIAAPLSIPTDRAQICSGLSARSADPHNWASVRSLIYKPNFNESSAKSSLAFSINNAIIIDWTYPQIPENNGKECSHVVGLTTADESFFTGILGPPTIRDSRLYIESSFFSVSGINVSSGYRGRVRITGDRRISFGIAPLDPGTDYITLSTSSQQPENLPPLHFYANFAYAGQRITNCVITYPQ